MTKVKFNYRPTLLSVLVASAILTACSSGTKTNANKTAPVAQQQIINPIAERAFDEISVAEMVLDANSRFASADMQGVQSRSVQGDYSLMNSEAWALSEEQENYAEFNDTNISRVADNAVSTFSIDVDTGAYSNVRRFLNEGRLPPADAVRAEELINYFAYDYALPESSAVPFGFSTEISLSPWNPDKHLLHIGLQAFEPDPHAELASNLVFLLDVSGSMNSPDKLSLLKTSLKMLSRQLNANDSVAIVVYAGASGVVLEPTAGNDIRKISSALDRLSAGGGTNGEAGIHLAYSLAQDAFIAGGINRVILATDGDFNVGTSDVETLKDLIKEKRESGISLTTLGFGRGNYNDHLMEQLADVGNGNYAYIDNLNEARKVLVDERQSTLQTVAKDVKIQIEFNPAVVTEYRLIGYENRLLNREDFNNDKVDAGEIGAGHTVTAIYEISLVGRSSSVDPLRYADTDTNAEVAFDFDSELAYIKLRYKAPKADESQLLQQAIYVRDINETLLETSNGYRFSAAVAGFSQLLRGNNQTLSLSYDSVLALANTAKGDDEFGYRSEFISMVRTAQSLSIN